jgi:hypothetical protein
VFWYRFAYWAFTRLPSWTEWLIVPTFAAFFFLTLGRIRGALAANLDPVLGHATGLERWRRSFLTIWAFAWCFAERFRRLANPKRFRSVADGEEHWRSAMESPGGVIVVTAHIGPWETAAQLGSAESHRRIHVVREKEIDPRAQDFIRKILARTGEDYVTHFSGDDLTGLGWCSPAYGRIDRATTVRIAHNATSPFWMVTVFDLDGDNEVVGVDWVPVWAEAGVVDHGTAIRISRAASVDHVLFVQDRADTPVRPYERDTLVCGRKPLWRVGDVETDARMLMVRASVGRSLSCVASVDATTARTRNLELLNPEPIVKASSCAALPVS